MIAISWDDGAGLLAGLNKCSASYTIVSIRVVRNNQDRVVRNRVVAEAERLREDLPGTETFLPSEI